MTAFEMLFLPWLRHRLAGVRVRGLPAALPARKPILLVANHVSWWDGFILRALHRRMRPAAPLYTAMLERELARFPFFRMLGAFGLTPGDANTTRTALRHVAALRARHPDLVFSFFPQGKIWTSAKRPLGFQRGVEAFAAMLAPAAIIPIAIHVEPLNRAAPTVFVSAGQPRRIARRTEQRVRLRGLVLDIEQRVAREADRIASFLDAFGEEAGALWGPDVLRESLATPVVLTRTQKQSA